MGQGGIGGQGQFATLIPIILMFVIFYFLLIRPQQKKQKEHRELVNNLKKDDRVVTSGGIYGRISGVDDQTVTVEIADKVRVKVAKGNISVVLQDTSKTTKKE